jgi:chromosome transmission fidelity protein 4
MFKSTHLSDITAAAWSPNGALLVTAGADRKLCLWNTSTLQMVHQIDVRATVLGVTWHPTENIVSYTNNDGELVMHTDFVPEQLRDRLQVDLHPAPLLNDPLGEISGNARQNLTSREKGPQSRHVRRGTPDSLDDMLGSDAGMSDVDAFVEDDDGAGYAEEGVNGHGKRPRAGDEYDNSAKRRATYGSFQPRNREAFQPGSTPWRGNRRYLCLNLTGFVWTVDQGSHHTVTVEFYDRDFQRDFHFTDPFLYDKACLNNHGSLFACPADASHAAMLYYRPHETWTARTDWRTPLPKGEEVVAIALSESYVVAVTSADYVRVYTLFGTPVKVYRLKNSPAVTCAAWRDYVLTVGNGPIAGDGRPRLTYSIENVRRDEMCQSEDVVALTAGTELQSVFFSDEGVS